MLVRHDYADLSRRYATCAMPPRYYAAFAADADAAADAPLRLIRCRYCACRQRALMLFSRRASAFRYAMRASVIEYLRWR